MRLCFIGDAGSIHLERWIDYFTAAGHHVDVISFRPSPSGRKNVHLLANGRSGRLAYLYGLFQIRKLLRKLKPDVLHAHYATSFGLLAVVSGFHPLVVSAWGSDVLVAPEQSFFLRKIVQKVLHKADAMTSDSAFMSERMQQLLKGEKKLIKTVTMGVAREWFHQLPDMEKKPYQILSLRGHQEIYNINIILRSMVDVVAEISQAELIIAGEGPETSKLKALTKTLGLESHVRFVGQLPHAKVQAYLSESTISVSVPSSDATAVSLLETMACGSFPVVTDLPANREWIEDDMNGLIVPARDPKSLAAALIRGLQSAQLRDEARSINREKVWQQAIWENNMAEMEALYAQLTGKSLAQLRGNGELGEKRRLCLLANAASSHTEKWAAELVRRNWQVDIISFLPATIPQVGVHIVPPLLGGKQDVILRLRWVIKKIWELKPDLLHAHYATSFGFLGALAGYQPLIISAWGSDIFSFPRKSYFHRLFLQWVLKKAVVLCSTSKIMAREMKNYLKHEQDIQVIAFGVDIEKFCPPEDILQLNQVHHENSRIRNFQGASLRTGKPVVFGVAKYLQPVYGLDILLKAFAQLEERCPGQSLLRIAGNGPELKRLQRLAHSLQINHKVDWQGEMPNARVADFYRTLDVIVVPSRQESFGVTAVEGSACGRPIIASRVGGLTEVVIDGLTGILLPPENVDQLAQAMEYLMKHPEERLRMGKAGRDFVVSNYDWQHNVSDMEKVYGQVLGVKLELPVESA